MQFHQFLLAIFEQVTKHGKVTPLPYPTPGLKFETPDGTWEVTEVEVVASFLGSLTREEREKVISKLAEAEATVNQNSKFFDDLEQRIYTYQCSMVARSIVEANPPADFLSFFGYGV